MGNMRFKVGDRVRIKSIDWYNKNKDKNGNIVFSSKVPHFALYVNVRTLFTKDMVKYCGKVVTIENVWTANYSIVEGTHRDYFTDEMIEGLVEEETLIERVDDNGLPFNEWLSHKGAFHVPEDYVLKDENGNVINTHKIVLEKKKREYPKTYEECSDILSVYTDPDIDGYKGELLWTFQKLLICRDAYWKLYGEEKGLGKPWEPDWNTSEPKYVIACTSNGIEKQWETTYCKGFAFPTEEMRDAFYENFKELIESVKELL